MFKKILSTLIVLMAMLSLVACDNKENDIVNFPHSFSVGEDKQVYFAPGNLQYNASLNEWRFAENTYDAIGINNELISADYDGWIDLFGWGANGISGIEPYCIDTIDLNYGDGHNDISNTDFDFSKVINNILGSDYRMFSHDEIHYLLMYRENADKLFGYCLIDDIRGLYILPDDFVCPDGIEMISAVEDGFINNYNWYYSNGENENYTKNHFSKDEWKLIEEAGGIFLPSTGMRYGNGCDHIDISGHYWTSSHYGEEFANCLCLFEHDLFLEGNFNRSEGLAVRLVKDAK